MSLLSVEHATKRYKRGRLERIAINDVSLEVDPGELVAVRGPRRSGRSTLLRVVAGIELPDEGSVSFQGRDLRRCRDEVLGRGIGFCQSPSEARDLIVDHVAAGLLALGIAPKQARRRAETMLSRVGAEGCGGFGCYELDGSEAVRVSIAAALIAKPVLLVIDDPTGGVDLLARDPLLALLRSVANEGVAVLMSTGDAQGLSSVDRALSMDSGKLRGIFSQSKGSVIPLRPAASPGDVAGSGAL